MIIQPKILRGTTSVSGASLTTAFTEDREVRIAGKLCAGSPSQGA
jgi:hypothetical protein